MPIHVPPQIKDIQERVKIGQKPEATVRTLLDWYSAKRRGSWIVSIIRAHMRDLQLATVPDWEFEYIDAPVRFVAVEKASGAKVEPGKVSATKPDAKGIAATPVAATGAATDKAFHDPGHSIRKLDAANLEAAGKSLFSVTPDKSVAQAITLMLANDFSQLPVMQNERKVVGMFSWQSLGSRLALGVKCEKVADAMDAPEIVLRDASIFYVAAILLKRDVVLVRASETDPKITGIVTTADLVDQFGKLGEPFLLLSQIENHVRACIDGRFTKDELQAAKDPRDTERTIDGVADMTFGEYVRLLEEPGRWAKCMDKVDRGEFVEMLKRVGKTRNEVMHFDPEGIEPDDLNHLRTFAGFLDKLARLKRQSVAAS